jgi:multiple sugar transport system permease protein
MFRYRNFGYIFVAPSVAIVVVTLMYPMFEGLIISFFEVGVTFERRFVGFENYVAVLVDTKFWLTVWRTLYFSVASVLWSLAIGLGLALLLNAEGLWFRAFWRVLFIVPWTISHVAAGLGWKWIFDGLYGVANDVLLRVGAINEPVVWLGSRDLAMFAVITANVWRSYPFIMLMLLAALQTIPKEQYESAQVDGSSAWQRFVYITLPHLKFAIFVSTALEFIFNVRQFDLVFVMTRGGPRESTEMLSTLVNRQAFEFFDYGVAAATSMAMLVMLVAATLAYRRVMRSTSEVL